MGSQIWWTWEVEDGFRQVAGGNKHAMKTLESKLTGVWCGGVYCCVFVCLCVCECV